ncbi:MAG: tripartite tricarboxylate transporter TctB family protein [Variibacter sp.]|nr:tripartite tricarboxylate transporter TctB family protein [Variibacter sp.]
MKRIRAPKDFFAGLMFIGIGVLGATMASHYTLGSALRMGPGYFPTMLSYGTIILGAIILLRSFAIAGEPVSRIVLRPLFFVLASIVLFGLLVTKIGLVLTTIAAALVGGLASREMGWIEWLALSIGLALFCAAVFVWGLGQPIDLWPV